MNIVDALVRLRDDLKSWVTHNMRELNKELSTAIETSIPTKVSELENDKEYVDKDYMDDMRLSLGIHTDGLIYIFKNGKPIGDGLNINNSEIVPMENLMETGELYLNQRYSQSSGGLVSDNVSTGMFALVVPITIGNYVLTFENLKKNPTDSTNDTMFLLDSNKANAVNVNNHNTFRSMSEGVEILDGGKTMFVTFPVTSENRKYFVVNITVSNVAITMDDVADYLIYLNSQI